MRVLRRRIPIAAVLTAVLGLGLVAPVAAAGEADAAPIKVGLYMPEAGNPTGVTYPQTQIAARATVKYLSKTTDQKWELVFCDPLEDPNEAATCGRQFVEEGVVAVVGGLSTQGNKINEILETAGIPSVGNAAINSSDFFSPISFPLDGGSAMGFPATVFQLARQGAKKIFVANLDVTAASIIVNFVKAACEGAGVEFVGSVTVPSAAPDMAPYVAAAQDAGADAVVTVLADPDAVKYMKAAQQVGAKFQFAHTSVQPQGKITEGMAEAGSLPPMVTLLKSPEGKEYLKAMKAYAKGFEGKAPGKYFQPFSYSVWNAIQAVKQVVEFLPAGTDITGPAVLEGFNTIPELDLGVVPPFKPAGPGPVKVFPRITNTYEYLITIKNNQQVLGAKDPINIAEKVDFAGALSG